MNLDLETATKTVDLSEYENEMEVAALIMALLAAGHDWVRTRIKGTDLVNQWTVLERDKNGRPLQIGAREFDGETEVISVKVI